MAEIATTGLFFGDKKLNLKEEFHFFYPS